MENGWIKLHRKITDWEWFGDSKTFHVFIFLLLNANRMPKKWKGYDIDTGQVVTGRIAISAATGISQQSVRTALSNLKSTNEITIKSTNKFSIITVCNYSKYQLLDCYTNQQNNQQSTSNQPAINNKQEVKEVKKVKKEPKTLSSEALRLSTLLADKILENNPDHRDLSNGKRDKAINRWGADIDKMIRLDNRQESEIESVITWCQENSFWRKNILSGEKLRAQYDKLILEVNDQRGKTSDAKYQRLQEKYGNS